ncbi:MAG: hypothetical protein PVH46_09185 [Granulosicoccaceae bacterium]|jgi:hypothetical protein
MNDTEPQATHYIKKEPKFCRCRVCHEHFYGETIEEARQACLAHGSAEHPDWGQTTVCFCPD